MKSFRVDLIAKEIGATLPKLRNKTTLKETEKLRASSVWLVEAENAPHALALILELIRKKGARA